MSAYQVALTLRADVHQCCHVRIITYTAFLYTCLRTSTRVREAPRKMTHFCTLHRFLRVGGARLDLITRSDWRHLSLCVAPLSQNR